jgi:putative proteasome-type protease
MTYCAALKLEKGLVFGSDSRTNAGVDDIATFRKMKIFEKSGERVLVVLSSGNLSITQAALTMAEQRFHHWEGGETLLSTPSLFDAARILGETLRDVQLREGPYLVQNNIDANASFLLGGQIQGEEPRLFRIYSQGNFIEATWETPYFQIGETKYGKPILDRVITSDLSLMDAAKSLLVSFDSTMRSNISVGFPIDILCLEKDAFSTRLRWTIEEDDPLFRILGREWSEGLKHLAAGLTGLPPPGSGKDRGLS